MENLSNIDSQDFKAWQKDKVTQSVTKYIHQKIREIKEDISNPQTILKEEGVKKYCISLGLLEAYEDMLILEYEMLEHLLGENTDDREFEIM